MANFFDKIFAKFKNYDEDEDSYQDEAEYSPDESFDIEPQIGTVENQRVLNFRRTAEGAQQQVIIVNPNKIDAAQEICNHIRSGRTVICNFENCDQASPQRILDFVNGAAYALDGGVKRVSSHIFLIAPRNVTLMKEGENNQSMSYLRQAAR